MPVAADPRITVVRVWRGRTPRDRADAYEAYLQTEGLAALEEEALAVETLREDGPDETEFVIISYWASRDELTRLAGVEPTRACPLPRDAEFVVEPPERVQVLSVVSSNWNAAPEGPVAG